MKLKTLLMTMLAAGVAASLAVASPPPGKGREAGGGSTTSTTTTEAKRGRSAESRRRQPVVMLVLKGEFVSGSEGSFAMLVKHSNRHARLLRGKQVTVKVDDKTKIRRQGKGKAEVSDLVAGDRLHVLVRARKNADASALELLARHVFARPARDDHDDDEDKAETGTTTTATTPTTTSAG